MRGALHRTEYTGDRVRPHNSRTARTFQRMQIQPRAATFAYRGFRQKTVPPIGFAVQKQAGHFEYVIPS